MKKAAMLAAAAAAGAPLGHDFCAINLSDNLKPWDLIARRLRLAAEADFAMALYNPRSASRPDGFARTLALLREVCAPDRLIVFARAVSTPAQEIRVVPLRAARPDVAWARPASMEIRLVLPAPLGPSRPKNSPCSMFRLTLSSA